MRDAAGNAVFVPSQSAAGTTNGAIYLPPGEYTVEIAGRSCATNYWAGVRAASDPVDPYDSGTGTTYPDPTPPPAPPGDPYGTGGSRPSPPETPPTSPSPDGSDTTPAPPPLPPGGYYGF